MQRLFAFLVVVFITKSNDVSGDFRPPAVPLIVFSPHISGESYLDVIQVWSCSDNLTDSDTVHWSGSPLAFYGLIDIDNSQTYRFLGTQPSNIPPLIQNNVVVQPWRTIYKFSTPANTIELILSFSQPTSIEDPYTYITFDVRTLDQKTHNVRIYFEESSRLSINDKNEKISWNRIDGDITILTMNSYNQIPFGIRGDATRNNWGYAHLISSNKNTTNGYQGFGDNLRQAFVNHQIMPNDDTRKPRHADDQSPSSVFIINLNQVTSTTISSYLIFLYDDLYSMLYFEDWQIPCWRIELNNNITLLINEAVSYYQSNMADITDSNELLITLLTNTGGTQYSLLASLVTRQITGALTRTWSNKYNRPQLYMKEISSDGDVSTVDVIFPSSPFFLWLHPEILRDILIPVLAYANNETTIDYNLAWAPHHLGTWPVCDISPDEQEQMPMEESANMLLMLAGIVQRLAKTDFLQPYWNVMEIWAQYLNSTLPDPGNQLCTDDFEGPSPHNCNLALKGILGLGAYAILLNSTGQTQRATIYMNQAQEHANYWMQAARDDENYRLQYDLPNTWSQKYNLIYQSILSLNLFPSDVAKLESNYYATKMLDFGIPLDSRSKLTKTDWTSWIAAFSNDQQQENEIFSKIYKFANESPDRVPFSDLYNASNGHVLGFRARPVMGGLFIRALLENPLIENTYIQPTKSSQRRGRVNKCELL
ncbi:unnamed protein product [Rotaria sordida]|uniref:Uncharacterized protein n=1 Tax=Rotaria sordida TaxID=392033 RepID=A0A818NC97_9BILA|nr:unnamed protein product [Rotaria sordida]CAF0883059.1 unnamed protein product [Rotaria sordida]CAF3603219.1 unnamed protein product [Rotaria sordida]CAF3912582.1 unnamed protein product [Rotaria sordida]